ncbi:MAG TPA: response regulator [Verrucomicrobiae bacterium]|nr:response regulator [Verrucomicrobiae bacterium]
MQSKTAQTTIAPYRVLIVDDEAPVRELLATLLRAPNRSVEMRDSAPAALEFLQHDCVDVAFVDAKMPGIAGTQFADKIKARCPRAHVVIHTGCLDATARHEARPTNAQHNSQEPLNFGEILQLADSCSTE